MQLLDQTRTPIFTALKKHWEGSPISGHVPGHKFGHVFPSRGQNFFGDILKIDATEISGLDDLHEPEGIIQEAQQLAADFYGADASFFLVNGSTVGNLAMILATCTPGSKVLVQRNCHKSILNGIELAGAEPVFLSCGFDKEIGVATSVEKAELVEALDTISNIRAVILTNPNYYGFSIDLEEIISVVHDKGLPILVDEAHGAHFVLGDPFPVSALSLGADVVVHSAHKTLPAMTMGSFLHIQGDLVKKERLMYYLRMLQSSSPSYPIMASLDLARFYLASLTEEDKRMILKAIAWIRNEIDKIQGIEVAIPKNTCFSIDPLKIVVRSSEGLSGFSLQKLLEREGVFVELADALNVLIIIPLSIAAKRHDMIERIGRALEQANTINEGYRISNIPPFPKSISQLAIPLHQQKGFYSASFKLNDSEGAIAAESIIPYPPGIPVLLKGERITKETIDYIKQLKVLGARFQGNKLLKNNDILIFKKVKE